MTSSVPHGTLPALLSRQKSVLSPKKTHTWGRCVQEPAPTAMALPLHEQTCQALPATPPPPAPAGAWREVLVPWWVLPASILVDWD